jgi:hypothetical protein
VAEIYQNRTAEKGRIFRGFSFAQLKKCITNESLDITWGICTRNSRSKRYLRIFTNFYGAAPKSVSGQQHPQILPHSNYRLFLAQQRNKNDKERLLQ